jgi:hypothetical protein
LLFRSAVVMLPFRSVNILILLEAKVNGEMEN